MSSLNEALQNAKKEMESQSVRLRNLEALLNEERRAREDAEERANRLERERAAAESEVAKEEDHQPETDDDAEESEAETVVANGSASPTQADNATARLQQKLDLMMSEMSELRIQMEKYRERAESAEADRKSLAEMIENIRQDNAKKIGKRRSRGESDAAEDAATASDSQDNEPEESEEGEIMIINEDAGDESSHTLIRRAVQNGRPVEGSDEPIVKTSSVLATRPNRHELALAHGAPAVSILTVVALGVAVMAWLNNYPKVDR